MRVLPIVRPSPEQMTVLNRNPRDLLIIRGAAGSGKTTTALLRLKVVVDFWRREFERQGRNLRVLVLTFNRTLAGYIEALAQSQVASHPNVQINILTFGQWARSIFPGRAILEDAPRESQLTSYRYGTAFESHFLVSEVDYVCGRFVPDSLGEYLTSTREGRGSYPIMGNRARTQLLTQVIEPYNAWKHASGLSDWNDLAVDIQRNPADDYDIVVVDEAQDFNANRVRAVLARLAPQSSVTFVLDSAQRIYPNYFRWHEVGIEPAGRVLKLSKNYRNTQQIARFATALLRGVHIGDDGTIPDFNAAESIGATPVVLEGRFSNQMRWAVNHIQRSVDLRTESVAFLHRAGGGFFAEIKRQLSAADMPYEELTRARTYPTGPENIALSTMASAKGLEFDHVYILGLSAEVTPHGEDEGDYALEELRRLLAMSIGRAKKTVVVGYKPGEESKLVSFLDDTTFQRVAV